VRVCFGFREATVVPIPGNIVLDDLGSGSGGALGIGSWCVSYPSFSRDANSDTVNTSINADTGAMADGTIPLGDLATNANGTEAWFLNEWKNTHEYNRVNKYSDLDYDAAKKDSGLYINTGAGDDTVTNWGSGAWDVKLGTGNDTYYSDNAGERAVWVFNTVNQSQRGVIAARNLNGAGPVSSENDFYSNFQGRLTVTLTLPSYDGNTLQNNVALRPTYTSTVEVTLGGTNGVSDLEINQAIKTAINTDPVLSKLLEAVDGPANTLVVRSRIDGRALDSFDQGSGPSNLNVGGFNGLQVNFIADAGHSASQIITKGDYVSALANRGVLGDWDDNPVTPDTVQQFDFTGARSAANTANRVHIENGQDVVVLSTGAQSQDVLVFDAANYAAGSKTTVVHFDTNSNTANARAPAYDNGFVESFVVSFSQLDLANINAPASVQFNGGTAVRLDGEFNGSLGNPVYRPADVVDSFLYQLKMHSSAGNYGYTTPDSGVTFGVPVYTDNLATQDTITIAVTTPATAGGYVVVNGKTVNFANGATVDQIGSAIADALGTVTYGGAAWTAAYAGGTITLTEVTAVTAAAMAALDVQAYFAPNVFGNSVTANDSFYWYRDTSNNFWRVTEASGTGLRFTHITSATNSTPLQEETSYVNLDPLTVGTQPTVDTVTTGHFTWGGLRTTGAPPTYVNPVARSNVVEGRIDGQEASAARIVVDYAGSSALYSYDFTFGDNVARIHVDKNDGAVTIAQKVAAAVDAAAGWSASRSGSVVTITHDTRGEVADWGTKYVADGALGEFDGPGRPGQAELTIEGAGSVLTNTDPVAISFFGVPVLVTQAAATAAQIATAIANTINPLLAAGTAPAGLAGWASVTANAGVLTFVQAQGNQSVDPITAFPDDAIATYNGALPIGLLSAYNTLPVAVVYNDAVSPDVFTVTLGSDANEILFGGSGGVFQFFGKTVVVPANATATQVAAAIEDLFNTLGEAYPTFDSVANQTVNWVASVANNVLTFTANTVTNPTNPTTHSALVAAAAHSIGQVSGIGADPTEVAPLVDTNDPEWSAITPVNEENGVNAALLTGNNQTANGLNEVGNQIGWVNPARETNGDGDYLDFSAWDAYKVVVNGATLLEVADTAGTGKYVNITGGVNGVYNFNLVDGASTTLIGVVDFGEAVNFDDSNFILFNDIIV
jgi:hypothetical protein